ncbi:MAG: acyl-CoA thioesterase [Acholeplasma sp.]|jgi:acyl-CoA thioester hydrolase|nr:MAG: acyl-CoA thioesterase [Acholeplasma sp.]
MKYTITIHPRYQETDQMGIIHHSVYPIWYEMGRVGFCEALGLPFHTIEEKGLRLAILSVHSEFIKSSRFGEVYQLETKITELSKVRMMFTYVIYNSLNELIHRGYTEIAWLNVSLRPINLQKQYPDIYALFSSVIEPQL